VHSNLSLCLQSSDNENHAQVWLATCHTGQKLKKNYIEHYFLFSLIKLERLGHFYRSLFLSFFHLFSSFYGLTLLKICLIIGYQILSLLIEYFFILFGLLFFGWLLLGFEELYLTFSILLSYRLWGKWKCPVDSSKGEMYLYSQLILIVECHLVWCSR
jgi:hypothetical protein